MGPSQSNTSGLAIELPALRVYPQDGKFPLALRDRFVFLTEKDGMGAVATLPSDGPNTPRKIAERITLNIGVCPSLRAGVTKRDGIFSYEYRLSNLKGAKQKLATWVEPLPFKLPVEVVTAPGGWRGSEVDPDESILARNLGYLVGITELVDKDRAHLLQNGTIKRKIDWFALDEAQVLQPGAALGPLKLRTKASPGIITAYFEGDSLIGGNSNWPGGVLDQVLALNWTENDSVSLLTIGPKFDPGVSRSAIAEDYLGVIDRAIKQKRLPTSPFLLEVMLRLKMIPSASNVTPWASKPETPLEKQIFLGMELSLNALDH
jgi:hypothetical protein